MVWILVLARQSKFCAPVRCKSINPMLCISTSFESQLYHEDEEFMNHLNRLSSPEGFKIIGFAGIIRQVRELERDLSYRNKQEKTQVAWDLYQLS